MANQQREHGRMSLEEIRRLTTAVAREEDPSLEVVAAMPAEGAESSSEVVLARPGRAPSERLVLRVDRHGSESELRPKVRERLRAAVRANQRQRGEADADEASNRVDELAADLDDLQTIADEIENEPPAGADPSTVRRLKRALSEATAAADDIENKMK
jgi:hypothetical protein